MVSEVPDYKASIGLGLYPNEITFVGFFIWIGNILLCHIVIGARFHGVVRLPDIFDSRRIMHRLPNLRTSTFVGTIVDYRYPRGHSEAVPECPKLSREAILNTDV